MPSSSETPTKEQWKDRLEPAFADSMEAVGERITNASAVQTWLHEASFEAAQGAAAMQGMQAEAEGYMHMMSDLEDTFPELVAAVEELTDGCGRLNVHWRPLTPNFSRVYVDFDTDYTVNVFCRVDERSPEAVRNALARIAEALPEGEPFPNRPNEATGLIACDGGSVGARIYEHAATEERGRRRTVAVLPVDGRASDPMPRDAAVRALLDALDG
jgi:hypothetical protein